MEMDEGARSVRTHEFRAVQLLRLYVHRYMESPLVVKKHTLDSI